MLLTNCRVLNKKLTVCFNKSFCSRLQGIQNVGSAWRDTRLAESPFDFRWKGNPPRQVNFSPYKHFGSPSQARQSEHGRVLLSSPRPGKRILLFSLLYTSQSCLGWESTRDLLSRLAVYNGPISQAFVLKRFTFYTMWIYAISTSTLQFYAQTR